MLTRRRTTRGMGDATSDALAQLGFPGGSYNADSSVTSSTPYGTSDVLSALNVTPAQAAIFQAGGPGIPVPTSSSINLTSVLLIGGVFLGVVLLTGRRR